MYFLIYLSIIFLELYKLPRVNAFGRHRYPGRQIDSAKLVSAGTDASAVRTPNEIFEAKTDANDIDSCELASEGLLNKDCADSRHLVSRGTRRAKLQCGASLEILPRSRMGAILVRDFQTGIH